MSNATTTATKLPEVLVLGGATYRISENPDLQAFVDSIIKHTATTEKDKLYGQIKSMKERMDLLEETSKHISTPSPIDYAKIEEIVNTKVTAIESAITTKVNDLLKPIANRIETQVVEDIKEYKNKLIRENDGKCMVELIQGETKEQLDASLASAIELFNKYRTNPPVIPVNTPATTTPAATVTTTPTTQPVENTPPATPAITVPPVVPVTNQASMPDIKSMSTVDFAKNREALKGEIASMLNKS